MKMLHTSKTERDHNGRKSHIRARKATPQIRVATTAEVWNTSAGIAINPNRVKPS
jgi:hypothetical protein